MVGDKKRWYLTSFASVVSLVGIVAVVIKADTQTIRSFSYGMTRRRHIADFSGISDVYVGWGVDSTSVSKDLINPLNEEGRALLFKTVMDMGECAPVSGGSGLQWTAGDVSPMCNCLDNFLTEFVAWHNDGSISDLSKLTNLTRASMLGNDAARRTAVKTAISSACFNGSRATQVETMDQETDASGLGINIVTACVAWNVVMTLSVLYQSFDYRENDSSPLWFLIILSLIIGGGGIGLIVGKSLYHSFNAAVYSFISISLVALAVMTYFEVIGNTWEFRKCTFFWLSYAFSLVLLVISSNSLFQMRDYMLTLSSAFLSLSVGLLSMGSDTVSKYIEQIKVKAAMTATVTSNSLWLCNLAIIASILFMPGTTFSTAHFSNAHGVVKLSLILMFTIPLFQTASSVYTENQDSTMMTRSVIEIVARMIFTVAVAIDLWAADFSDIQSVA